MLSYQNFAIADTGLSHPEENTLEDNNHNNTRDNNDNTTGDMTTGVASECCESKYSYNVETGVVTELYLRVPGYLHTSDWGCSQDCLYIRYSIR